MPRLLCVEDTPELRDVIVDYFSKHGYQVDHAGNGKEGVDKATGKPPDAILMDLNLPDGFGLDFVEKIKQNPKTCGVPILVFTAHHKDGQLAESKEHGADGYLVKGGPLEQVYGYIELLIKNSEQAAKPLTFGTIHIDPRQRQVSLNGHPLLALTPKEFDLLWFVASKTPEVISWERLAKAVWKEPTTYGKDSKTIELHAQRIRRKLGPDVSRCLTTHRGVGLQFNYPPIN